MEIVTDFIFWGSKITAEGDCSHEIERRLLLGRKVITNLDSIFKNKHVILPTKVCLVKAMGFPGSSADKESACDAGDPGSIPGLGRAAGERIGYQLQYSWASLVAELVKNLPAMQETWV